MKKLFKNLICYLYYRINDTKHINFMYNRNAKENLLIQEKIVNVKKGKRKYTLYIIKTAQNKTIFNLNRH